MLTKLHFTDVGQEVKDKRTNKTIINYFLTTLFIYISTDQLCVFVNYIFFFLLWPESVQFHKLDKATNIVLTSDIVKAAEASL